MNARKSPSAWMENRGTLRERAPAIDGIKRMLNGSGTFNRNDLLIIPIEALTDAGVGTGPQIFGGGRQHQLQRRKHLNAAQADPMLFKVVDYAESEWQDN